MFSPVRYTIKVQEAHSHVETCSAVLLGSQPSQDVDCMETPPEVRFTDGSGVRGFRGERA